MCNCNYNMAVAVFMCKSMVDMYLHSGFYIFTIFDMLNIKSACL